MGYSITDNHGHILITGNLEGIKSVWRHIKGESLTPQEHEHYLKEHVLSPLTEKYSLKEPVSTLWILDDDNVIEIYTMPVEKLPTVLELLEKGFIIEYLDGNTSIEMHLIEDISRGKLIELEWSTSRGIGTDAFPGNEAGLIAALRYVYKKARV